MTFGIQSAESFHEGLRREIREQVRHALGALGGTAEIGGAAHRFRRTLKRARALLKQARPILGAKACRSGNRTMRDAARLLGPVRDAGVLVETTRSLIEQSQDGADEASLGALLVELEAERDRLLEAAAVHDGPVTRARNLLQSANIDWTEGVELEAGELLRRTMTASYKAVRFRARAAFDGSSDPEAHHELRKRVKQIRHQVEFLRPACPQAFAPLAKGFHRLTDFLGDGNDLVVLGSYVESSRSLGADRRASLLELLCDRRRALWAEAASLGEGVLAKETGDFVSGLVESWTLARPQG